MSLMFASPIRTMRAAIERLGCARREGKRFVSQAFGLPCGSPVRRSTPLRLEALEDRLTLTAGPIPFLDFAGVNDVNGSPPDPIAAAGPDNLISMVNRQMTIRDKDGTLVETADFGNFFDTVDHGYNLFDPRVLYDRYSDRFVVMATEKEEGPGADEAYYLIGISTSSTPDDLDVAAGDFDNDWNLFSVSAAHDFGDGLAWNDKPMISADADSLYLTANYITFSGGQSQAYARVTRLDKTPMLGGTLGSRVDRDVFGEHSVVPVVSIGRSASEPQQFIVRSWQGDGSPGLRIYEMDDSDNFTEAAFLPTSFFGHGLVPQQGTQAPIITQGTQLINAVWRSDSLWTTHTVGVTDGGDATVRWYEIDTTGGVYSIAQQGDIDPGPGVHTFLPSIAVDAVGNMAVTYTQSSASQFPNMMLAGRQAADPAGTTTPGIVIRASDSPRGQPAQTGGARWGDYSGITVDPADDATFWAFNQYERTPSAWGTWWSASTFRTASIWGHTYHDLDGDGLRQPDEPDASPWPIFLDGNNNGVIDDATSLFAANDVPMNIADVDTITSRIEVDGLAGLVLDVNVSLDITHTFDADLDVALYSPSGTRVKLFSTVGGSGDNFTGTTLDDSAATTIGSGSAPFTGTFYPEEGLFNFDSENPNGTWTLIIHDDAAGDTGTLDRWSLDIQYGDPVVLTGFSGSYSFTGLAPGPYVVREQQQSGWLSTAPAGGRHVVALKAGEASVDHDFGNTQPASIAGTKWHDLDGDGARDVGEPGLAGQTVFADVNNNGSRDTTTAVFPSTAGAVAIEDHQTLASPLEISGLDGLLLDVDVTLDITHTFDGDLTVFLVSPSGTPVELFSGIGSGGNNFTGTTLDDETGPLIGTGSAPFSGTWQPAGSLADLDGQDPNGTWLLRIEDSVSGDTGTLNSWSVDLTYGDPSDVTDGAGDYQIPSIASGRYAVREELLTGWMQTYPDDKLLYAAAPLANGTPQLAAIDPGTGGAVFVGPTGTEGLVGLAADPNGNLFGIDRSGPFLRTVYSVNPLDGTAVPLFDLGASNFTEGGFAIRPDGFTGYGVRTFLEQPPELFMIDSSSEIAFSLGPLTLGGSPLAAGTQVDGLAFRGNTLYGLVTGLNGNLDDHLITIDLDPATRAVTDVGPLGTDIGLIGGLAYDAASSRFYASGVDNNILYALDPDTGSATLVGPTGLVELSGLTTATARGTPLAGARLVYAGTGSSTVGVDFGDTQAVAVRGIKYRDDDGNGQLGQSEPPLAGRTVYLDLNDNGLRDVGAQFFYSRHVPKTLPDAVTTLSTLAVGDVPGQLVDVDVELRIDHTFDNDLEIALISPIGTRVTLVNREGGSEDNFSATTFDDQAATPIGSGTAPFNGSFQPEEPLATLAGEDPNGVWSLEVTDHAVGDTGTLIGWNIRLTYGEPTTVSGAEGEYVFGGLAPGRYDVREQVPSGWLQTEPVPAGDSALSFVDDFEDRDLLEYTQPEVLNGAGFINASAAHDGYWGMVARDWMVRDDPAATVQRGDVISAWVRFANNASGRADLGFGSSAAGTLALELAADTSQLILQQVDGYNTYMNLAAAPQVYEPDTWYRVEIAWGATGVVEARLYGADGATRLSTVTAMMPSVTSGGVAMRGIGAGVIHQFDTITRRRGGAQTVVLGSGEVANDRNFGNAQPGTITGVKWHDRNGDAVLDGNEQRLPDWTVWIDADRDGLFSQWVDTFSSADVDLPIPDAGTTVFALPIKGLDGLLVDADVTLDITHPWDDDLDVFLISPAGVRVELFTDVGLGSDNFTGTTLDDEAVTPIGDGTAPFTGAFRPEGSLSDFDLQDPNGIWRLEITDDHIADVGVLNSWSLTLTTGDPTTLTDAIGRYQFSNLAPGAYQVREFQQPGWIQTAPPAGFFDVNLGSGQTLSGNDFGNRLPWLAIDDVAIAEGNTGTADLAFTVTLLDPSDLPVTANFETIDGTAAAADGDFQHATGVLSFLPGDPLTQTLEVTVNGDTDAEPDETLFVDLFGAANATLRRGRGVGTILDDDSGGGPLLGDMDVDGDVDFDDIDDFVLALSNPAAYFTQYGVAREVHGDTDQDGDMDFDDIDDFVALLNRPLLAGDAATAAAVNSLSGNPFPAGDVSVTRDGVATDRQSRPARIPIDWTVLADRAHRQWGVPTATHARARAVTSAHPPWHAHVHRPARTGRHALNDTELAVLWTEIPR